MPQVFETMLVFNVKGKADRRKRDGKTYLVANGVLINEGVHTGTTGPVLYTKEFIGKVSPKGNGKPIVLNHPRKNGQYVTANTGDFLETSGLGDLSGVSADGTDMKSELWFDEERTKKIDRATYDKLDKGEPLEVSTGFVLNVEEKAGDFQGTPYKMVALDVDDAQGGFDHLAVVTEGTGACSNRKGCGANLTANCGDEACERCGGKPVVGNDTSFSRIYGGLSDIVYKTLGYNHSIREVYPKFFVYRDGNGELFKKSYTVNADGDVSIGKDEPVKVRFVQEYRTDDGNKFVGNASTEEKKVSKLNEHITALVANKDSGFGEDDREYLTKKGEEWCAARVKGLTANAKPPEVPPKEVPVVIEKKQVSAQEYLTNNSLPPEIADILTEGLAARDSERDGLIKVITANKANIFNPEHLKTRPLAELRGMARLAGHGPLPQVVGNYAGAGAGVVVGNSSEDEEEPLPVKRMDFTKKK